MVSLVEVLPAELLDRIFSFLADTPAAIAASRLTCRDVHSLSSPYLITSVVFAKRLPVFSRLIAVLRHPYFRCYVTELIYDASAYSDEIADDWNRYVGACTWAPREFHDGENLAAQHAEKQTWCTFREYSDVPLLEGTSSPSTTLDSSHADGGGSEPDSTSNFENFGNFDENDRAYAQGHDKGFPQYRSACRVQSVMETRRLVHNVLFEVLNKFPKLQCVVYTDYRGLIKPHESFDEGCRRMFGNTLQPMHNSARSNDLAYILDGLSTNASSRVTTLELRQGPYVQCASDCWAELSRDDARKPSSLSLHDLGGWATHSVLSQIRRLSLVLDVGDFDSRSVSYAIGSLSPGSSNDLTNAHSVDIARSGFEFRFARVVRAFDALAPSLRYLDLSIAGAHGHEDENTTQLCESAWLIHAGIAAAVLLRPFSQSRLHTLCLSGFVFTQAFLSPLLLSQGLTLRQLRLQSCAFATSKVIEHLECSAHDSIAKWAGQNLALEGVQISNCQDEGVSRLLDEDLWLADRPNHCTVRQESLPRSCDGGHELAGLEPWFKRNRRQT